MPEKTTERDVLETGARWNRPETPAVGAHEGELWASSTEGGLGRHSR
jgi:hypothetical protein